MTPKTDRYYFNLVLYLGDDGDNMYVVDQGELDVLYASEIVATLGPGNSFGEVALMYNRPRTATIKAKTECKLWAMDRNTFRRILMSDSIKRRALYESFLAKVPIFGRLFALVIIKYVILLFKQRVVYTKFRRIVGSVREIQGC